MSHVYILIETQNFTIFHNHVCSLEGTGQTSNILLAQLTIHFLQEAAVSEETRTEASAEYL